MEARPLDYDAELNEPVPGLEPAAELAAYGPPALERLVDEREGPDPAELRAPDPIRRI